MSLCGLRRPPQPKPLRLQEEEKKKTNKGKGKEKALSSPRKSPKKRDTHDTRGLLNDTEHYEDFEEFEANRLLRRSSANFAWARDDQLSTILEIYSDSGSRIDIFSDSGSRIDDLDAVLSPIAEAPSTPHPHVIADVKARVRRPRVVTPPKTRNTAKSYSARIMSTSNSVAERRPEVSRPIAQPPRDLAEIAAIDRSLIFEHFTTNDAWDLGSALRNRLLPIPTPVVINISLANQNQILFHTCTHPGVMPDNDTWVARKRKTVLRWGVSTWYMHCKFDGDEFAFRDKYGLGNSAGEYAIHGGGVPIRVTGVEGVVAVVVVSGLKQAEDHAIVVEVIRELYY